MKETIIIAMAMILFGAWQHAFNRYYTEGTKLFKSIPFYLEMSGIIFLVYILYSLI